MVLLEKRPRIGLALGAGAARGLAHIGVLKILEKHNIPVDYVAGTSMGALIGGLYSVGISPLMIEKLANNLSNSSWVDLTIPKKGLISGERIEEMLRLLTKGCNIEDSKTPIKVVATDIENGKRVVIDKGPLYKGIRASISIPGIFKPVEYLNKLLVDGALVDRVPAEVVRDMGADIVIAVDVNSFKPAINVNNIFDILLQTFDIMEKEVLKLRSVDADVVIKPDVSEIGSMQFTKVTEGVLAGEDAMESQIHSLKDLLGMGDLSEKNK